MVARRPVGAHTAGAGAGARGRRAEPPVAGGRLRRVLVLDLAVAVLVVVVLLLVVLLGAVGVPSYSKQLVQHAIDTARARKLKSIRLDCIEGNDVPQKMYMSFGFTYIDTVEITYVDIGTPREFLLYELVL